MLGDGLMFDLDLSDDGESDKKDAVEQTAPATDATHQEGSKADSPPTADTQARAGRTVSAAADIPTRPTGNNGQTEPVELSRSNPVYIPGKQANSEESQSNQQQASSFVPGPPPGTKPRYRHGF